MEILRDDIGTFGRPLSAQEKEEIESKLRRSTTAEETAFIINEKLKQIQLEQ